MWTLPSSFRAVTRASVRAYPFTKNRLYALAQPQGRKVNGIQGVMKWLRETMTLKIIQIFLDEIQKHGLKLI
jgi:hypothetical protein